MPTREAPQQLSAGFGHGLVVTALHVERLLPADPTAQHIAVALGWVEHVKAADLLVPQFLRVSQRLQLRLVLPHKVDAVALGAPEWLLELQEDLVGGADAQLLNGIDLVLGQRRREQGSVVLLQDAQGRRHDDVVGRDPLLVLALYVNRVTQDQGVLVGMLAAVAVVVVIVAPLLLAAPGGVVPVDAADGFAKADGAGRDVLSQQLHNLDETFWNDEVRARDLCPLAKLAQRHLVHVGGAALTAFHLKCRAQRAHFHTRWERRKMFADVLNSHSQQTTMTHNQSMYCFF